MPSTATTERDFIEAEPIDEQPANEDPQSDRSSTGSRSRSKSDVLGWTRDKIREHPLPAVGGAFALGFILGNGLPKFLARTAVAIGLRMVAQRVIADALGNDPES